MRHGIWVSISLAWLVTVGCSGARSDDVTQPTEGASASIQQELAAALRSVDEYYAQLVADSAAKVEAYPAPFLTQYRIYWVEHLNPNKPIVFYVGFAPGSGAYILTGAAQDFVNMTRADGVVIDSPEAAVSYAVAFLEVTRSMSDLFYVVQSVDEMHFRPNLSAEQEQVKGAFIEEYQATIRPASATVAASGYRVTVYAVREQALERHELSVSPDGAINDDITVLDQDRPRT